MATTPRQVIDSVLRSVCGHEVEQLVRLSGGVHETYRVELAAAGSVVVRIGRQPVPWFTDEEQVMAQARAVGVPTPDVLGVAHVDHDGELLAFSIQRLLPGRCSTRSPASCRRRISSGWSWTAASCWRACTASCPTAASATSPARPTSAPSPAGRASSRRRSVRRRPRSSSAGLSSSVASWLPAPRRRWRSRTATGCPSTS